MEKASCTVRAPVVCCRLAAPLVQLVSLHACERNLPSEIPSESPQTYTRGSLHSYASKSPQSYASKSPQSYTSGSPQTCIKTSCQPGDLKVEDSAMSTMTKELESFLQKLKAHLKKKGYFKFEDWTTDKLTEGECVAEYATNLTSGRPRRISVRKIAKENDSEKNKRKEEEEKKKKKKEEKKSHSGWRIFSTWGPKKTAKAEGSKSASRDEITNGRHLLSAIYGQWEVRIYELEVEDI